MCKIMFLAFTCTEHLFFLFFDSLQDINDVEHLDIFGLFIEALLLCFLESVPKFFPPASYNVSALCPAYQFNVSAACHLKKEGRGNDD